jgi:HPt (histidine-containing phosphotransfer) domain-containing protein
MGMEELQEKCTLFEDMCRDHRSMDDLAGKLNDLMKAIKEGKTAAEEDYQKLIRHNKANP